LKVTFVDFLKKIKNLAREACARLRPATGQLLPGAAWRRSFHVFQMDVSRPLVFSLLRDLAAAETPEERGFENFFWSRGF
jgi:hypothetical protein